MYTKHDLFMPVDQPQPRFNYICSYLHLFQPHTIMNNSYHSKSISNDIVGDVTKLGSS